ncbi:MAG: hypothetical protein ACQEWL_06545 [Pseudomonadota bacterium]
MHNLYELYEKLYFLSLEERDRLHARNQLYITIYTAYFAVVFYLIRVTDLQGNKFILGVFFIILLASIFFMGWSVYYTSKAICNHKYKKIATCQKMSEYNNQLKVARNKTLISNIKSGIDTRVPSAITEFKKNLCNSMGKCTDYNNNINELRMTLSLSSVNKMKVSLCLMFVSGVIFIFGDLDISLPRKSILTEDKSLNETIRQQNILLNELSNRLVSQPVKSYNKE